MNYSPSADYITRQPYLSWRHRGILVDWIVQVHYRFKLLPETLFLTINILDRYLSKKQATKEKLQLVGIGALMVAAKYEEIYPPPISDYLYIADGFYKQEEILEMERTILSVLQFNLGYSSPLYFLRRLSKAEDYDVQSRTIAKYLMEVAVLDERFLIYTPSCVAASSIRLARRMLKRDIEWTKDLEFYSTYCKADLDVCVDELVDFMSRPNKLDSIYKKFASSKQLRASLFVEQWVNKNGLTGAE